MDPGPNTTVIVNWRDLSHPQAGGAEMYCEEVACRLARDGRRVVLLTSSVADHPSWETRDGYLVVRRGGPFTVYLFAFLWLWRNRGRIDEVIDSQCGIPFLAPLAVRRDTPVVILIYHVHQEQLASICHPSWRRSVAGSKALSRDLSMAAARSSRSHRRPGETSAAHSD